MLADYPSSHGSSPAPRVAAAQRRQVVLILQQLPVVDGGERVEMPIAERLAPPLQCLTCQRRSGGEIALLASNSAPRLLMELSVS